MLKNKPGVHIAHTVQLQKESENQPFYPIEKNIRTTIFEFYQQNPAAGFLIYLALKFTFLAGRIMFEEISGVEAQLESNGFNLFFRRCCYIQS